MITADSNQFNFTISYIILNFYNRFSYYFVYTYLLGLNKREDNKSINLSKCDYSTE